MRLCGYWQISGLLDEGRQWLGRVADLFPEPATERAWALGARGRLATLQGDLARALADIGESIELAVAAGSGAELAAARGYLYLNLALTFTGQHAEALAAGETARQRLAACGYRIGLAGLEAQLAHLHQLTGNVDEAIECCDRGLALLGQPKSARAGGERWVSGYLYLVSGLALAQRPGREHASAKALGRALTAKHELGDVVGTAYAVEALAWLAARREQYERTAWLIGAADQLWNRTGRRLSGVALMEESRQRTVKAARKALGERRYAAAYAHGTALDLDAVVRDAASEAGETAGQRGGDADAAGGPPVAATAAPRRAADQARAGDRGARGQRAVQPGDRHAAVHLQADRRRARRAHLQQAGDLLPRPAHGPAPGPAPASARHLGLGPRARLALPRDKVLSRLTAG